MLTLMFSSNQLFGLVGLGGVFWATAAFTIRSVPEILFGNPNRQIMSYLAAFPVSFYGFIRPTEIILGISPSARVYTSVILSAAALLLDGIAMMWFPHIYENPELMKKDNTMGLLFSRRGASWLLWGVGVGLTVALLS
jgi:hypothetical protein